MKRVLVWGFSNNLAGTEAVVSNYISRCNSICFDILSYENTPNHSALFDSGRNKLHIIPKKSSHPIRYWLKMLSFFREYGGIYDTVWCNYNSFSNVDVLTLAVRYGISRRIVHAHNSMPVGGVRTKVLSAINRERAIGAATDRWACSDVAGRYFFGDLPYVVLPNAIDYRSCLFSDVSRMYWREKFSIDSETLVLGFLGRLTEQKNCFWIIDIARELYLRGIIFKVIIAGDGEQRAAISERITSYGLSDCVIMAGSVSDAKGLLSALDVFLLPSLFEGLPLSLLEAQANGLPCIVSDRVSKEAVISDGCIFLPLDDPKSWVDSVSSVSRFTFDPTSPLALRLSLDERSKEIEAMLVGGGHD